MKSFLLVWFLCIVVIIGFAYLTKKNLETSKITKLDDVRSFKFESKGFNNQALLAGKEPAFNQPEAVFWVKVAFSAVLLLAALWVVLSKQYDPNVQKWAIGILGVISGVWVGSAT